MKPHLRMRKSQTTWGAHMVMEATSAIGPRSSLLLLLLFLLCIGPVCSSPMFEASKAVLNSTAKSFSACVLPLKECPNSDTDKEKHIWCIRDFNKTSCPIGYHYFCGKEEGGYLVEGCFKRNICPKGTANEIDFNPMTREASLKCVKCGEDHIQPHSHDSSRTFRPGCENMRISLYIYNNKDIMKKVYDGHPKEDDQYICDTSQGYSDIAGHTLCNVNTECNCKKNNACENHLELLPDGRCDRKCADTRNIWDHFSCDKYVSEDSTSILPTSTDARSPGEDRHRTTTDSVHGSVHTKAVSPSSGGDGLAVGYIVGIAVVGIVVIGVVVVLCCFRQKICPRQKKPTKEEPDVELKLLPNNGIHPESNKTHETNNSNNKTVNKRDVELELLPNNGIHPESNKTHETNNSNNKTVNKRNVELELLPNNGIHPESNKTHETNNSNNKTVNKRDVELELLPNNGIHPESNKTHETNNSNNKTVNKRDVELELLPNNGIHPESNKTHETNNSNNKTVNKRNVELELLPNNGIHPESNKTHETNNSNNKTVNKKKQIFNVDGNYFETNQVIVHIHKERDHGTVQGKDQGTYQERNRETVLWMDGDREEQPEGETMADALLNEETACKDIDTSERVAQPEMMDLK